MSDRWSYEQGIGGAMSNPDTHEYEVECTHVVEARTPEQAVLQAAAMNDDGGSYRWGYRVRNVKTGEERFIDAETIDEDLDEVDA